MNHELPPGWAIAALGEIGDINPRHSRNLPDGMLVSFAPMPALSTDCPEFESLQERQIGEVRKGFTHFAEGDVLFAKITPCMENGKGAVAVGLRNGLGCGTTEIHVVRPLGRILPHYMFHYLHQPSVRRQAEANFTGSAGQARVPVSFIKDLEVPLPPLAEQQRIVAKLEVLLGKVDACRKRLEKIPVILKRFRQSVLAAACSGRLTADWRDEHPEENASVLLAKLKSAHQEAGGHKRGNAALPSEDAHDLSKSELPESWEIAEMRDLVEPSRPITYGILKPGPDLPEGILYIRVADYPKDKLNPSTVRRTSKAIEAGFSRARLREGDILLSIRGTVGRVCVVPKRLEGANITQDTARLGIQNCVDSRFVTWFLRALPTQNRMGRATKGAAVRGINIGDVRALQVPIPPLAEQHEIVRRVEALFTIAVQIETRYTKAKTHIDRLTQSILAKAFRGDLVPQDPNDEPATVLLERIRSQREAAGNARRQPRSKGGTAAVPARNR